jgi:hypothetical protein
MTAILKLIIIERSAVDFCKMRCKSHMNEGKSKRKLITNQSESSKIMLYLQIFIITVISSRDRKQIGIMFFIFLSFLNFTLMW